MIHPKISDDNIKRNKMINLPTVPCSSQRNYLKHSKVYEQHNPNAVHRNAEEIQETSNINSWHRCGFPKTQIRKWQFITRPRKPHVTESRW